MRVWAAAAFASSASVRYAAPVTASGTLPAARAADWTRGKCSAKNSTLGPVGNHASNRAASRSAVRPLPPIQIGGPPAPAPPGPAGRASLLGGGGRVGGAAAAEDAAPFGAGAGGADVGREQAGVARPGGRPAVAGAPPPCPRGDGGHQRERLVAR